MTYLFSIKPQVRRHRPDPDEYQLPHQQPLSLEGLD